MTVVSPPSGAIETWTLQSGAAPVKSSTKLPSSSGPERASVVYDACSSFDCIQSAIVLGAVPCTASTADAGPLAASSAGVAPEYIGKSAGSASQIRPQAVSVRSIPGDATPDALDASDVPGLEEVAVRDEADGAFEPVAG